MCNDANQSRFFVAASSAPLCIIKLARHLIIHFTSPFALRVPSRQPKQPSPSGQRGTIMP